MRCSAWLAIGYKSSVKDEPYYFSGRGIAVPFYGTPGDAGRGSWPGPYPLRQFTWDLEYPEIDGNTGTPGEAPGGRV